MPATVDGAALRCLVVCAHGAGLDVAGVLPADAEAQELPLPQVIALVTALLQRGEPGWALRGAPRVPLGAMGVLDHLCQAAPTVRACLTDFARYFALVAYRGHAALEGDALVIAFDVDVPALERMFVEATVGLVWSRLRDYLGRPEASPARVELRGPVDPRTRPGWERAVGGELLGDRPANRVVLPSELADAGLIGDNAPLRAFLDGLAAQALPAAVDTWAHRVAQRLARGDTEVELGAVAKALAVSERTLRRRLAEEGTSFSELRQRELQRRAEGLLAQGQLSPAEIAFCLGFSEMSAFNRAFRRWTGCSPGAWRQARRRA